MAKTALELIPAEWRAYQPAQCQATQRATARWQRAWDIARLAANLLREQFGAQRVVVFGSLTCAAWFTPWSDIDVAAWGIPACDFYRAVAVITGLSPEFQLDLLDPDTCRPTLRQRIEREGIAV